MIQRIEEKIHSGQGALIAEIGVNYYDIARTRNLELLDAAKLMIQKAADAGVDAVKFQSYKADTLASRESPYYWDIQEEPTRSQYELFRKFDLFGEKEYKELADYSEQNQVEFLSTPFDMASADYLEPLMNWYKISSSDLNNLDFVRYMAKKNKPILLSVGASNLEEISNTVALIREYNDRQLVLMHCVLEYPTPPEHANLYKIQTLQKEYPDVIVGYSDHTKPDAGYQILRTAYILGARVIEKHFTLDKSLKGNDHYHAMDPEDVQNIISAFRYTDRILGDGSLICLDSELGARKNARRSLVAKCDIPEGACITADMLTWKRPGSGITADQFDSVIGKKAVCSIEADTVLQWDMLEE